MQGLCELAGSTWCHRQLRSSLLEQVRQSRRLASSPCLQMLACLHSHASMQACLTVLLLPPQPPSTHVVHLCTHGGGLTQLPSSPHAMLAFAGLGNM